MSLILYLGTTCPDPGTPPNAKQKPCDESKTLSYEVDSCVTYSCDQSGYKYTGRDLNCVPVGGSVQWNDERGSCEG